MNDEDYDFFAVETNEISDTSNTASTSASVIDGGPLRSFVADMMFANGDAAAPDDICITYILQLLHEQLNVVLRVAHRHAQQSKSVLSIYHAVFIKSMLISVDRKSMLAIFSTTFDITILFYSDCSNMFL